MNKSLKIVLAAIVFGLVFACIEFPFIILYRYDLHSNKYVAKATFLGMEIDVSNISFFHIPPATMPEIAERELQFKMACINFLIGLTIGYLIFWRMMKNEF